MASNLTPAMQEMLNELQPGKVTERYRNGWQTAKALQKRGLVKAQWIGMGWYRVLLTSEGLTATS